MKDAESALGLPQFFDKITKAITEQLYAAAVCLDTAGGDAAAGLELGEGLGRLAGLEGQAVDRALDLGVRHVGVQLELLGVGPVAGHLRCDDCRGDHRPRRLRAGCRVGTVCCGHAPPPS